MITDLLHLISARMKLVVLNSIERSVSGFKVPLNRKITFFSGKRNLNI